MKIYSPAEDSYLLAEALNEFLENKKTEEKIKLKVLDLGTGSGIQSKNCILNKIKKENITAVDISEEALKEAEKLGVKTIKSDLFENINEKFDLIIFNPPYLPEDKYDKEADTTGGKKGDEIISRFIKQLSSHLTEKGTCFLLTSSYTPDKWKNQVKKQKLTIKRVSSEKLFFEELYVWEINLR